MLLSQYHSDHEYILGTFQHNIFQKIFHCPLLQSLSLLLLLIEMLNDAIHFTLNNYLAFCKIHLYRPSRLYVRFLSSACDNRGPQICLFPTLFYPLKENEAATKIQAHYRGYSTRKNLSEVKLCRCLPLLLHLLNASNCCRLNVVLDFTQTIES